MANTKPKTDEIKIAITAILMVFKIASKMKSVLLKFISKIATKNFFVSKNGSKVEIEKSAKKLLTIPISKNTKEIFNVLFADII